MFCMMGHVGVRSFACCYVAHVQAACCCMGVFVVVAFLIDGAMVGGVAGGLVGVMVGVIGTMIGAMVAAMVGAMVAMVGAMIIRMGIVCWAPWLVSLLL